MRKYIFLFFMPLISCSPKSDLHEIEWRSGSSKESIAPLEGLESTSAIEASVFSHKISIRQQQIKGVPVEDTYIKEVFQGSDRVAVRGRISSDDTKLKNISLDEFLSNKDHIEKKLKTSFPVFRKRPPLSVSVVIAHHKGLFQPLWKVIYVDDDGVTWDARFNNFLQIQRVQRVGSHFQDALAWVYPNFSKRREIQEVLLSGLFVQPTLANSRLMVSSQNTTKVLSIMEPLKFNNKDPRFDQVQAFYFLNESLSWFQGNLGFQIPFVLQAEVQVGYPEKTNSAFYYQGKIRLGAGDDEVYSHLAQDPSVVVHESVHALVDSLAGLPFEGEGGSLNEGFADFFTAVQLNNPNMGELSYLKGPFRRSVVNNISMAEKNGGLYHDSGIISGALWDLKEQFGGPKGLRVAALTLARLVPGSDFKDFSNTLRSVVESEFTAPSDKQVVDSILKKRGL